MEKYEIITDQFSYRGNFQKLIIADRFMQSDFSELKSLFLKRCISGINKAIAYS